MVQEASLYTSCLIVYLLYRSHPTSITGVQLSHWTQRLSKHAANRTTQQQWSPVSVYYCSCGRAEPAGLIEDTTCS